MSGKTMRKIVRIDPEKCDGCGLCVPSCAEGAIQIVDGKARLAADNLCDGLGACLGKCPRDAITIEERPADAFDEAAVTHPPASSAPKPAACGGVPGMRKSGPSLPCGCPGSAMRKLQRPERPAAPACPPGSAQPRPSHLTHWPVQLMLLPEQGPVWQDADVLLSADCVAVAMPDYHDRLLAGKTVAVACPKLDDAQFYVEKLARIFAGNDIRRVTVARMEVPCCAGLVRIAQAAMQQAGKAIPIDVVVVTAGGEVVQSAGR